MATYLDMVNQDNLMKKFNGLKWLKGFEVCHYESKILLIDICEGSAQQYVGRITDQRKITKSEIRQRLRTINESGDMKIRVIDLIKGY